MIRRPSEEFDYSVDHLNDQQDIDVLVAKNYKLTAKNIYQDSISLMYPFYALNRLDKEQKVIEVSLTRNGERKKDYIFITPSASGLPNMMDKNIMTYCVSKLIKAKNSGDRIFRSIKFDVFDYYRSMGNDENSTGGSIYKRVYKSLDRLRDTSFETNFLDPFTGEIKDDLQEKYRHNNKWSFITAYRITQEKKHLPIEITIDIAPWLFNLINRPNSDALQLNYAYYQIDGNFKKRFYEICRKFCGEQELFEIGLLRMKTRMGSLSTDARFKFEIRKLCEESVGEKAFEGDSNSPILDYIATYDKYRDVVSIRPNKQTLATRSITYEQMCELALQGELENETFYRLSQEKHPDGTQKYFILMNTKSEYLKKKKEAEEEQKNNNDSFSNVGNTIVPNNNDGSAYDLGGPTEY